LLIRFDLENRQQETKTKPWQNNRLQGNQKDLCLFSSSKKTAKMSKSSLLFTIEQWELIRRLRNSGLTKDHVCQAYDDLERIERDLCNMYTVPNDITTSNNNLVQIQNGNTSAVGTDPLMLAKNLQNFQVLMTKNLAAINYHQRLIGNLSTVTPVAPSTTTTVNSCSSPASPTQTAPKNLTSPVQHTFTPGSSAVQQSCQQQANGARGSTMSPISDLNSYVLNSFANEIEDEARELEEFRM
jgi:hypothetical protein